VAPVGWQKIELKKSAVEKNKKYRRVGKEGRLTCCPFEMQKQLSNEKLFVGGY